MTRALPGPVARGRVCEGYTLRPVVGTLDCTRPASVYLERDEPTAPQGRRFVGAFCRACALSLYGVALETGGDVMSRPKIAITIAMELPDHSWDLVALARIHYWGSVSYRTRGAFVAVVVRDEETNARRVFASSTRLVVRGLEKMAASGRHWEAFARILGGVADGYDLDLLVQFATFGTERYG